MPGFPRLPHPTARGFMKAVRIEMETYQLLNDLHYKEHLATERGDAEEAARIRDDIAGWDEVRDRALLTIELVLTGQPPQEA